MNEAARKLAIPNEFTWLADGNESRDVLGFARASTHAHSVNLLGSYICIASQ